MRLQCTFKEESSLVMVAKVTMVTMERFSSLSPEPSGDVPRIYIHISLSGLDDNFRPKFLPVRDPMTRR